MATIAKGLKESGVYRPLFGFPGPGSAFEDRSEA